MAGTSKVATSSLDWKASLSELFDTSVGLATNYYGTKLSQELRPEVEATAQVQPTQNNKIIIYGAIGIALFFAYQYFK